MFKGDDKLPSNYFGKHSSMESFVKWNTTQGVFCMCRTEDEPHGNICMLALYFGRSVTLDKVL